MLIIEKGTKAEPKPKKKAYVGKVGTFVVTPPVDERQTRGVMCTYTCNQGFGGGGLIFLLKCTHSQGSWGVVGDSCQSKSQRHSSPGKLVLELHFFSSVRDWDWEIHPKEKEKEKCRRK